MLVIFVHHHYIINSMKWSLSIHVMPTWQRPRLTAASPVLKAMLDSSMQEGESRRIRLEDCSSASVSLFLETLCPAWKMTGWWFGTWVLYSFMTFHSVGKSHPNWRSHIFQRGRSTTKQMRIFFGIANKNDARWLLHGDLSIWKLQWLLDGV